METWKAESPERTLRVDPFRLQIFSEGVTTIVICAHCNERSERDEACATCGKPPLLRGRYRLEEHLGDGASGTTYRARDLEHGRSVAVKELAVHGLESFKAHELFEREADVLCRLDHPDVPTYYDRFSWGEGKALRFYLVMEFIEGPTLAERLENYQYSETEILEVVEQLAEVAGYLHGRSPPVVHRDIKPTNVMRRPDGSWTLIDFGSVRAALEPNDSGSTIAGTIGYMAPEQLRGSASPASDVYGICAVALHLATRLEPSELLDANNRLDWNGEATSEPFAELLSAGLSADPNARPPDGATLAGYARDVRNGRQLPSEPRSEGAASDLQATPGTRVSDRPVPAQIELDSDLQSETLSYRWYHWFYIVFLVVFCLPFDGTLVGAAFFVVFFAPLEAVLTASLILLPFLAVGFGLAYFGVAGLVNSTVLRVTESRVSVEHEPLPWRGSVTIERSRIENIACRSRTIRRNSSTSVVHDVFAEVSGNEEIPLLKNMADGRSRYAEFIANWLRTVLEVEPSS